MDKFIQYFKRFDFPVSTHSFGLFRMLYAAYNLGLICQLYLNWPFYFDHVSPYSYSLFPVKLGLLLWSFANVLVLAGLFTRYAALGNYVLVVLFVAYFPNLNISSFNDDLLRIGGFLLIILPTGRSFSLDSLFRSINLKKNEQTTSYLYYLLAVFLSLGLLYFGSGVTKLFSPMWQKGLGIWIPAVLPSYKWNTLTFFSDQQWLMYFLNYTVIVFELTFVVLLFNRKTHPYIAMMGIGFHLGIALLFPFYYISFGPIIYYSLLIPAGWWQKMRNLFRSTNPVIIRYHPLRAKDLHAVQLIKSLSWENQYHFIEDTEVGSALFGSTAGWKGFIALWRKRPLCFPFYLVFSYSGFQNLAEYTSEQWLPQQFQPLPIEAGLYRWKRFVFFVFVAGLCGIQILILGYHTKTTLKADKQRLSLYLKKRIALQDFSTKPSNLARTFFGINSRGLFLDHAFTGSKTVYAIAQQKGNQEEWLPLFTKEGYCVGDNLGFSWHKLAFNYFAKTQTQPDTNGLKKYTLLWAKREHLPLHQLSFTIYRRIYPCPTDFEQGYLQKMTTLPWDTVGRIHWNDSIFSYENLMPDTLFK
jgi:uncharacterized membrane protein YphA (DoxX/SURF4 family)